MNALSFDAVILKVEVRKAQVKHERTRETPTFFETIRIGKLTLEFNPDTVDLEALSAWIRDTPIATRLAATQGPEHPQ